MQADDDANARIPQVERMRVSLASVADDRNGATRQSREIRVGVVEERRHHGTPSA
jgi:hypothetical protein